MNAIDKVETESPEEKQMPGVVGRLVEEGTLELVLEALVRA